MRTLALLVAFLPQIALADPSPTCGCLSGFSAFGSGADATEWNQIFLSNRTICLQDGVTPDSNGNGTPAIRPCVPKTADSGTGKSGPAVNPLDRDLTFALEIKLSLTNRGECIKEVHTLLLNVDKLVGAAGTITDPEGFCQSLFPVAERKDLKLEPHFAATFTMHGIKECLARAPAIQGKIVATDGPLKEVIGSPEAFCSLLYEKADALPGVAFPTEVQVDGVDPTNLRFVK